MSIKLVSASVLTLGVFLSCASGPRYIPPSDFEVPPDRWYQASFDDVWNAILETVTDLDIPIENMEKVSGFLRSDFMRFPKGSSLSEFMDCGTEKAMVQFHHRSGTGVRPEWRPVTQNPTFISEARLTVLVREIEGRQSVRLRTTAAGVTRDVQGWPTRYDCRSTGRLEQFFFDQVEHRVTSR